MRDEWYKYALSAFVVVAMLSLFTCSDSRAGQCYTDANNQLRCNEDDGTESHGQVDQAGNAVVYRTDGTREALDRDATGQLRPRDEPVCTTDEDGVQHCQ